MDADKLAKLTQSVRIGGKGTPRRKVKKVQKGSESDDKKIQTALGKLNAQVIPGIQEANFFQESGTVLHFSRPQVQAAAQANTVAIHGRPQEKDLSELMPNIITQLGSENLAQLKQLAEQYTREQAEKSGANQDGDDEGVPELVEGADFDNVD